MIDNRYHTVHKYNYNYHVYLHLQDSQNIWYEAVIRGVRITEEKVQEIAVHYIGWVSKWDEWIDCKAAEIHYNANRALIEPTIDKRNTNTFGPHRPHILGPLINKYQTQLTQLLEMGFNNTILNIQALIVANGDVEQSKAIIASPPPDMHTYNKNRAVVRPYDQKQPRQQGPSQYNNNNNNRRHGHGMSFCFFAFLFILAQFLFFAGKKLVRAGLAILCVHAVLFVCKRTQNKR